ncbi:kinase-like protein [Coniochaeta ligniaria NRRL 30616]|uniref:Kinase-like protein n=1 Tax=Coniochaeta ligniaria NRRL 30616 TaxID=1408157 RepID=A0A1J7JVJ2_9PEZI|nr:kinase-like protein [Coniochaeta ligniaria NRRL 30616]
MAPVTNQMLNERREKDCVSVTLERKYFQVGGTWIKRSLRPSEWQINPFAGTLVVPRFGRERLLNEAAAMRFIAANTSIPVPKLYACFEDDGAVYLVMEYVEGVSMAKLNADERKVVEKELEGYLEALRKLKSSLWGGPSGIVVPPYRVMVKVVRQEWKMRPKESKDLVYCHNDLSTHNVIVDPATLKVKAVIDWEYSGFYPAEFEGMYFRRPGPSVALEGEPNDEDHLVDIMLQNEAPHT